MTNNQFIDTFAPCCSGDRNCGRFNIGDSITFDASSSPYSVRPYVGTVVRVLDGALLFHYEEIDLSLDSMVATVKARHLNRVAR